LVGTVAFLLAFAVVTPYARADGEADAASDEDVASDGASLEDAGLPDVLAAGDGAAQDAAPTSSDGAAEGDAPGPVDGAGAVAREAAAGDGASSYAKDGVTPLAELPTWSEQTNSYGCACNSVRRNESSSRWPGAVGGLLALAILRSRRSPAPPEKRCDANGVSR
jgi:hypothetical protein